MNYRARSTHITTYMRAATPVAVRVAGWGLKPYRASGGWTASGRGAKRARAPPTARTAKNAVRRATGFKRWTIGLGTRTSPHICGLQRRSPYGSPFPASNHTALRTPLKWQRGMPQKMPSGQGGMPQRCLRDVQEISKGWEQRCFMFQDILRTTASYVQN